MSEKRDDPELEALKRELDDAFATTRPRRGFEDELWLRMQARRPLWPRLRESLASLGSVLRQSPAIPLGAVAVLLVVVIGAGVLLNSGLRVGGQSRGALSAAGPVDRALGEFGRLPTPALHPGLAPAPNAVGQQPAYVSSPSNLYFGPASLRWTGQMPLGSVQAPVYRYAEPSATLAQQFAAAIGASTTKEAARAGFLGTYAGQDFNVMVLSTVSQLPRAPYFVLTPSGGAGAGGGDAQAAATNFLDRYSLAPPWPNTVTVQHSGSADQVQYLRAFQLGSQGGLAYVIDWTGERYGIEVDLVGGQVRSAAGPLPLTLDSTVYPLIANDRAVGMALASTPASSQGIQPVPTVDLKSVELVYSLAVSGNQGFYEPAYLFSGTFTYNGQTYTKRVLVPLVDPSVRSS